MNSRGCSSAVPEISRLSCNIFTVLKPFKACGFKFGFFTLEGKMNLLPSHIASRQQHRDMVGLN